MVEVSDQKADQIDPVSFVTDEMVDKAWEVFDGTLRPALEAAVPLLFAKRDAEIRARIEAEYCVGGTLSAEDVAFNDGLECAIALLTEGVDGE